MKHKCRPLYIALCVAMASSSAFAVDFNGYVRAGTGIAGSGGGLQRGDEFHKNLLGRLGNEFDTYAEIGLGQELFNQDDHSMYLDTMFSMESDGNMETEKTSGSDSGEAEFGIKKAVLKIKGYIPDAPDATIWAGKRFYQRQDVHIIDTKFLNISGYGAGVEGLNAGPGTLSLAVVRGDDDIDDAVSSDDLNIYYLDARYSNLKPWDGAWAEVAMAYAVVNPTDDQDDVDSLDFDNGFMFTAQLSQSFSRGYNKTALQYGTKGLAQNMISQGGGWYDVWSGDVNSAKGYRLINTGDFKVTDNLLIDHVITYGYAQDHGDYVDDENLLSIVMRPTYSWSNYNKTILELGYFKDKKSWTSGSETKTGGEKITLAHAFTVGKEFLSRPELRFYVSYFKDEEGTYFKNGSKDNDIFYGAQFEAWW
ncbi:maltoporin LamB [Vibrio tritonius]|uniref:maltoporin LamB n=1 Tax=Vibrio tritonius TaxID=1435069 RepID=UPI00315E01C6